MDRDLSFLRRLDANTPAVFVLGSGGSHGLSFIRSLGQRGIPVVAIDREDGPAMWSRYCLAFQKADPVTDEAQCVGLLEQIGERLPTKGVLIPASDVCALLVSRNRTLLRRYFLFALTQESSLEMLANKKLQYQFAEEIGIPTPKTYYPDSLKDVQCIAEIISYPCLIKPIYSRHWGHQAYLRLGRWKKVATVESAEDLVDTYRRIVGGTMEFIIQEKITGGDDQLYALYTCFDRESQPLAVFVRRKLRQWPVGAGDGCFSVSVYEPEVVDLGLRILRATRYQGLANIEFKKDPNDSQFKLIEVNIRSALQIGLAVDAGVDIPYIAYRSFLGQRDDPVTTYKSGVKWLDLGRDIKSFLEYRKLKQLSWWSWLRSLSSVRSHAYFDWSDPVPFLIRVWNRKW